MEREVLTCARLRLSKGSYPSYLKLLGSSLLRIRGHECVNQGSIRATQPVAVVDELAESQSERLYGAKQFWYVN